MSMRATVGRFSKQCKPLLGGVPTLTTAEGIPLPGTSTHHLYSNPVKPSSTPVRTYSTSAPPKRKLVEVGRLANPTDDAYKSGQVFLHKVMGYRGIVLYSWSAKVYDKTIRPKSTSNTAVSTDGRTDGNNDGLHAATALNSTDSQPEPGDPIGKQAYSRKEQRQGLYQTYYKVLIHDHDWPYIKMPREEDFTVLVNRSNYGGNSGSGMSPNDPSSNNNNSSGGNGGNVRGEKVMHSIKGIDFVSHDDIIPLETNIPFNHSLFQYFFETLPDASPSFIPKQSLQSWKRRFENHMSVCTVNRETTENIRVTIIPFYVGDRKNFSQTVHFWRYTARLENLGDETVTLRRRSWKIFSINGSLETFGGKGVVGYEPSLSALYRTFQYSSHVSLTAPSGHMWGEYIMERSDGSELSVRIPSFTLDSKIDDEADE